jgi:hypothetical protein
MDNFDLKKFVSEKTLLNENAPGYDTRKTGESLPTLESVKAAYEAKNDIKEDASKAKELSDRVLTVASEGIKDLNGVELMEFRALIAQAFDMKDEAKNDIKEDESEFERNTPGRIDQLIILLSNAIPLADDLMEDENVGEMYDFAELSQQLENFINDLNLFSGN